MPYTNDTAGIYQIRNEDTGEYYVGATKRLRKRTAEHMRLLRLGKHPNNRLQKAYSADADNFTVHIEVQCDDIADLDWLEEEFLQGRAWFGSECKLLNLSYTAKTPMKYRRHTEQAIAKMRESAKLSVVKRDSSEYRQRLSEGQQKRHLSNPKFREKLKFILDNQHMSYAELARAVGSDTSAVRRLALKYADLRGEI